MERLEAAMAKARARRQKAHGDEQSGGEAPASDTVARGRSSARITREPSDLDTLWQGLKPIEISSRQARRKRLGTLLSNEFSTPYDILRTRVLRQMRAEGWTHLAITSPNTACGKTTLSMNLALSLARHAELRVILMDFDLRRPRLAGLLGVRGAFDMAGLLAGRTSFADHAVRFGENLAIGLNSTGISRPAELLLSSQTSEILEEIEAQFQPDIMIFDTPPMLGNDDNLAFLSQVDCTLLVAGAGSTSLAQIDAAERDLSGLTNVVGTALNKCRYLDTDETYSGGYY